jgi:uncharacterized protein (TIGR02147 family)
MKTSLPSIYQYGDFRKFLRDYQKARWEKEKTFTKSAICKKLGLPNTRNFLNNVIAGRKLTSTYIERFVRVFEFGKEEAGFFRVLVKYNQAENAEEREIYLEQLISLNKTPKKVLDRKAFEFFRHWRHSVIRALLDAMDFKDDYKCLASLLFPPVTPKQARDSIRLLFSLELIRKDERGFWRPSDKSIMTSDYLKDELISQYQSQCLDLAKLALAKKHGLPQNVTTNIISVSSEGIKHINNKIDKFRSEIRSLVHKDDAKSDCAYQLNIQLFPAARLPGRLRRA